MFPIRKDICSDSFVIPLRTTNHTNWLGKKSKKSNENIALNKLLMKKSITNYARYQKTKSKGNISFLL